MAFEKSNGLNFQLHFFTVFSENLGIHFQVGEKEEQGIKMFLYGTDESVKYDGMQRHH
jgi:hypothetical protein